MDNCCQNEIQNFKSKSRWDSHSYRRGLILKSLLSLPKTILFNFKCFSFENAIRLPILVSYNTKLVEIHKGAIQFTNKPDRFMIKIGFGGSEGIVSRKSIICLEEGTIQFAGRASFSEGIVLRNTGRIFIGDDFFCNKNCTIWCSNKVNIGNSVLFGWNITVRDHDGHLIIQNGNVNEITKPINIGNHTWICSETHMLKGASIGNDCVVGYRSLVTSTFLENEILIGGHPAKKIKENINWKRG